MSGNEDIQGQNGDQAGKDASSDNVFLPSTADSSEASKGTIYVDKKGNVYNIIEEQVNRTTTTVSNTDKTQVEDLDESENID